MSTPVFVYIQLDDTDHLVGRLWPRMGKRSQGATFEYDRSWLENPSRFALEPALSLHPGSFHTPPGKAIFGAIGDSAPDRWGRILMRRAARRQAKQTGKAPQSLREIDFLLLVDDAARQGALRFARAEGGPFLSQSESGRIPPMLELSRLLRAAENVIADKDSDEELQMLLAPGSSLGGARPKASVRDRNSNLIIAKFPHQDDEIDVVTWEGVALNLARQAGISVPETRIKKIANKPILLSYRFDRKGNNRIPFLSGMSMIGAEDNEIRSYLELADALRRYGAQPREDLKNLWKRMVFNILISNVDDHLRNHGFLYSGTGGWTLSPAYDLNPTPVDVKPRILSTAIDYEDQTASLENAFAVAEYFGIDPTQANNIVAEIGKAVTQWDYVAREFGLSRADIDRMSTAFEHNDLKIARKTIRVS